MQLTIQYAEEIKLGKIYEIKGEMGSCFWRNLQIKTVEGEVFSIRMANTDGPSALKVKNCSKRRLQ